MFYTRDVQPLHPLLPLPPSFNQRVFEHLYRTLHLLSQPFKPVKADILHLEREHARSGQEVVQEHCQGIAGEGRSEGLNGRRAVRNLQRSERDGVFEKG